MKLKRVLPFILFAISVAGFVLLNYYNLNFNSEQTEIIQSPLSNNQKSAVRETAKVSRVVDGDTIKVLINGEEDTVRLIGIDSPEVLDKRKPVQCFGREASDKAKGVLTNKTVVLESDPTQDERDEYERLLRYVFFDGLNFSKFMISEGYAREYTFKNNPYRYQSEFIEAEKKAEKENKGLWSLCRS